jgi:hypothetical protein
MKTTNTEKREKILMAIRGKKQTTYKGKASKSKQISQWKP